MLGRKQKQPRAAWGRRAVCFATGVHGSDDHDGGRNDGYGGRGGNGGNGGGSKPFRSNPSNRSYYDSRHSNPSGGVSSSLADLDKAARTSIGQQRQREAMGRFGIKGALQGGLNAFAPGLGDAVFAGGALLGMNSPEEELWGAIDVRSGIRDKQGQMAIDRAIRKGNIAPPSNPNREPAGNDSGRGGVRYAAATTRRPLPYLPVVGGGNPAVTGGKYIRPITLASRISRRAPGGDRFVSLPNRRRA